MVASVGEEAVSAVSLVDSVMILIITIMGAMATGGAVIVGRFLGQRNKEMAIRAADQLIIFIFTLALVIMGLMYVFRKAILQLMFGDIDPLMMDYCCLLYTSRCV